MLASRSVAEGRNRAISGVRPQRNVAQPSFRRKRSSARGGNCAGIFPISEWEAPQARMGSVWEASESATIRQSGRTDECADSRMVPWRDANENRTILEWVKNDSRMGT